MESITLELTVNGIEIFGTIFFPFLIGALGGVIIELVEYALKSKRGEFVDEIEPFRTKYLTSCIVSPLCGGVVVALLSVTGIAAIWQFVIGMTAVKFVSQFAASLN